MSLSSCIYEGHVRHRRLHDVEHDFRFPLYMMYLDLDELDEVFRGRWLWSVDRPALAAFWRRDHFGDPEQDLRETVRALVEQRIGRRPTGPIRLLTQLRHAGYVFNPVSFYYCFRPGGRVLDAVVAEVNNTPWGERHCYVIDRAEERSSRRRAGTPKVFHVSPFMGMEMSYAWELPMPGRRLDLGIANLDPRGRKLFDACLSLERRALSGANLARALVRYPMISAQATIGIYWQALRLWRKGATFHPHPDEIEESMRLAS